MICLIIFPTSSSKDCPFPKPYPPSWKWIKSHISSSSSPSSTSLLLYYLFYILGVLPDHITHLKVEKLDCPFPKSLTHLQANDRTFDNPANSFPLPPSITHLTIHNSPYIPTTPLPNLVYFYTSKMGPITSFAPSIKSLRGNFLFLIPLSASFPSFFCHYPTPSPPSHKWNLHTLFFIFYKLHFSIWAFKN